MPVTIEPGPGKLIVARVSGKISPAEWLAIQQAVAKRMSPDRLTSFLIIVQDFQGWEHGDWDDMSFQMKHDRQIGRMAIVAEKRWEDELLLFAGKGFRKFDIRYFPPSEMAQARAWLAAAN